MNLKKIRIHYSSFILLFLIPLFQAEAEDYTKRFLLGVYAGHTDKPGDQSNHERLHLNFLFGYDDDGTSFYDNFCSEEWHSANAVSAYSVASLRGEPEYLNPTSLYDWKNTTVPDFLGRSTGPNLISHLLGEEFPEFYDKVYFDAMNFVSSEVRGPNEYITCAQGGFHFRPDIYLWVEEMDFTWFYPHCFNFTYEKDDSWYQDSLQNFCVDNYNRIAAQVKKVRKWRACPNFHWKANMHAWQNPTYGDDPSKTRKARKPIREEMIFEAWLCFSRGAKGLTHFLYQNQDDGWIGLVDWRNNPNEEGVDNYHLADLNGDGESEEFCVEGHVPHEYFDGDDMFTWAAEVLGQFRYVDSILKVDFDHTNGLYDVDMDTFRSVQQNMYNPLYYLREITIENPMYSLDNYYYEISIHRSQSDNFFMLLNRSIHIADPVTYNLKIGVPYGDAYDWTLINLVDGNEYQDAVPAYATYQVQEFNYQVELPPGEAGFFIMKYNYTGNSSLTSQFEDATGYSNGRKIAFCEHKDGFYTFLAYTDMIGTTPHIDYAVSGDFGSSWHVTDKYIEDAEYPAMAGGKGGWPVIAYIEVGSDGTRIVKIRDCCSQSTVTLLNCGKCGSQVTPPSIDMYIDEDNKRAYHVTFAHNGMDRIFHYIVKEDNFTGCGPLESNHLYLAYSTPIRRTSVVCDSTGRPYVFFGFDDTRDPNQYGHIYMWDGVSSDAKRIDEAGHAWDVNACIDDPALLLTWVAKAQCTFPSGEIHGMRGLLSYSGQDPTWVSARGNSVRDYDVIDPNIGNTEPQSMGSDAAVWESGGGLFSARDEEAWVHATPPWMPRTSIYGRCPQSVLEQQYYLYATARTYGSSSPYTIEVDIDSLCNLPPAGGESPWKALHVHSPNGGEEYYSGDKIRVIWSSLKKGVDRADRWICYLSTDGGSTFPNKLYPIATTYDTVGHVYSAEIQRPSNVNSDQCRLRVQRFVDASCVGDTVDISDENFTISNTLRPWKYPIDPITYAHPPFTPLKIYWQKLSISSISFVKLQYSTNNGLTWQEDSTVHMMSSGGSTFYPEDSLIQDTLISPDSTDTSYEYLYWGTIEWTIPNKPTSAAKVKLIAYDSSGNSSECVQDSSFVIPMPGGWEKNTFCNQDVWDLNDAGDRMALFYTGRNPQDTTKRIIYYTESSDGYSLDVPDSIGCGYLPSHKKGEAAWLSRARDTVYSSYWNVSIPGWNNPVPLSGLVPGSDKTLHSPIGIDIDADTVHLAFEKWVYWGWPPDTIPFVMHVEMLKDAPIVFGVDTLQGMSPHSWTQGEPSETQPSIQADGGDTYIGFMQNGVCNLAADVQGQGFVVKAIGNGSYPCVALSEGNVTYSYLGENGRELIRLVRYRDDTAWIRCDTFSLTDSTNFLSGQYGILYNTQITGDTICKSFLYDPLGRSFAKTASYKGSFPHSYLWRCSDDQWTECYTGYIDTFSFVKTETRDLNAFFPSLYQEAKLRRSPYTLYRDTVQEYGDCITDYGTDSLVYEFNRLNLVKSYSVKVELYFESVTDTIYTILIQIGEVLDTVEVPNNTYIWHQICLPSASSSFTLKLYPLSGDFVSVSRLAVGQIDASLIMSGGGVSLDPEPKISFCLYQPFPNPFTSETTIRYSVPFATNVRMKVYDVAGRQVKNLVEGEVTPGVHTLRWEGKDDINRRCASGVYFVRFETDQYQAAKKMVLIK